MPKRPRREVEKVVSESESESEDEVPFEAPVADEPVADEPVADEAAEAKSGDEAEEDERPKGVMSDPYLLEDAEYIKKETRWMNKQRNLVFSTRGVDGRHRHLLRDFFSMMPHHKQEPKLDKKTSFVEIREMCELKSCNNCVFVETRKYGQHAFMYISRAPEGPTFKFQMLNVHTSGEVKLSGNCLMGSRPFLCFDEKFNNSPHMRLIKEMFTQTWGVPRNHPKSKPFFDHVISFHILDEKIWFRHYQISPTTSGDHDDPEKQQLTEIGPRFVLDPVMILEGCFSGKMIYKNAKYMTPVAARKMVRLAKRDTLRKKIVERAAREKHQEENQMPEEEMPLDLAFEAMA